MTFPSLQKTFLNYPTQVLNADDQQGVWLDFSLPNGNDTQPTQGATITSVKNRWGDGVFDGTAIGTPTYRISDTTAPSKLPVVRTNGTTDGFITGDFGFDISNFTIFVAGKFPNSGVHALFVELGPDANNNDGFYLFGENAHSFLVRDNAVVSSVDVGVDWPGPNFMVTCATANNIMGSPLSVYKNGVVVGTAGAAFSDTMVSQPLNIALRDGGAGTFFTGGDWGELILFLNIGLPPSKIQVINDYLMKKWLGIPAP
jgi:hypothetical protein